MSVCSGNINDKTSAQLLGTNNIAAAPYTQAYFTNLAAISYTRLTVAEIQTKVNTMSNLLNRNTVISAITANTYVSAAGLGENPTLEQLGFPAVPSSQARNDIDVYNVKVQIFCEEMLNDFCLRYSVFKAALNATLSNIVANKTRGTTEQLGTFQTDTASLNQRCQKILKAMNIVIQEIQTRTGQFQSQVRTLSETIDSNTDTIKKYNTILTSGDLESDVHKRMTEYTYEKNKNSGNLLALYGGLNIVALAMLVYIYRS